MTNQTFEAVAEIARKLLPGLLSSVVYEDDGIYVLYNAYEIVKNNGYYKVHKLRTGDLYEFSSLRNATTWCTLDWYNKIVESNRVLHLDSLLTSIDIDKKNHSRLKSIGAQDLREIYKAKLLFDTGKQKHFQWELDKYIILARMCQEKGFKNELK